MTKNSKHRATKLMAGLVAAALSGCAHHAAPAPMAALTPDTTATPAPTAEATPTTAPAVADAAPTTAPAAAEAAPTTAPIVADAGPTTAPTVADAAPATAPAVAEAAPITTPAPAQEAMATPTAAPTPAPAPQVTSQPPIVPAQTNVPENISHGEWYDAEDAARSTGLFAQSQAASGAKADAMLYDRNFDGSTLNSLGQVKLDLILKATPGGQPVVVYLNMPHDAAADRQVAVAAYLKTAGVPDQLVKLVEGPNTNLNTPSAYNLGTIYKVEGMSYSGEAVDAQVVTGGTPASGK